MPRPPSDRVEEGFRIWSNEANRNDTKTAAIMGLSQETVSYWHRTYGWDARYLSVLQPDGELFAGLARAHIRAILPAAAERLRHIVEAKKQVYNDQGEPIGETWASSDRDAIQAAKLLTQYGFEGGAGQDSLALEAQAMPILSFNGIPLEALSDHDKACAIIEANYQSVNTRIRRGKRV